MSESTEKEINKKSYIISEEVREVAKKVIEGEHLNFDPARIEYMEVYPCINKTTPARCIRANNELTYFSNSNYIIEVSGDLWQFLPERIRYLLVFHELLHILPVQNEKTGDWKFELEDHDVQDFARIIKDNGVNWLNDIKDLTASTYDIDRAEMGNLSI